MHAYMHICEHTRPRLFMRIQVRVRIRLGNVADVGPRLLRLAADQSDRHSQRPIPRCRLPSLHPLGNICRSRLPVPTYPFVAAVVYLVSVPRPNARAAHSELFDPIALA